MISIKFFKIQQSIRRLTYCNFYGETLQVIMILLDHILLARLQWKANLCWLAFFETIKLFQYHNLKTSLLECDGGSSNSAVIKASHGCHGAYSVKDTSAQEDRFKIEPWIINPFNPPNKIFWLICPSHQVCNFDVLYCLWSVIFS